MAETIVRSRLCGAKDIHVALVTKNETNEYKTEEPIKIGRTLSIKVSDKFTQEKIYSDDNIEDIIESYEGTDLEVNVNTLAPQDYALLFENLYKHGFLLKASGDGAKEVAIGWRAKKRNGKYEFNWYYCGKFERPEQNYETQEDKTKTQTASLKASFYARSKEDTIEGIKKNLYSIQVDESNLISANSTATEAIGNWFSKVQEYKEPTMKNLKSKNND